MDIARSNSDLLLKFFPPVNFPFTKKRLMHSMGIFVTPFKIHGPSPSSLLLMIFGANANYLEGYQPKRSSNNINNNKKRISPRLALTNVKTNYNFDILAVLLFYPLSLLSLYDQNIKIGFTLEFFPYNYCFSSSIYRQTGIKVQIAAVVVIVLAICFNHAHHH